MKVGDLMTRHVEFISPEATASEAAEMMGDLDVGAVPVGAPDDLQGVLTDRDILYRVVAERGDPGAVRVADIASRPVIGCGEDDSLQAAMDLMAAHHIRRLVVREESGRVTGWITLSDLARELLVGSGALQASLKDLTGSAA